MTKRRHNWEPIATAPFQTVILVKNRLMDQPVKATRGYQAESGVCEDTTLFTGVYTPGGILGPLCRDGQLICPDEWAPIND